MTDRSETKPQLFNQIAGNETLTPAQAAVLARQYLPSAAYIVARANQDVATLSREDEAVIAKFKTGVLSWEPGMFRAILDSCEPCGVVLGVDSAPENITEDERAVNAVGLLLEQAGIDTTGLATDMRAKLELSHALPGA